jgi:hypothetical protein
VKISCMVFNPFHIAIYLTYRWLLLLLGVIYCGDSMFISALQLQVSHMNVISVLWIYKTRLCFMPFCFNIPSEFTPLFNLSCLIFGLLPFGWFIYIYLRRLFVCLFVRISFLTYAPFFRNRTGS